MRKRRRPGCAIPRAGASTPRTAWGDPEHRRYDEADDLRSIPVRRPTSSNRAKLTDAEYASGLPPTTTPARELNQSASATSIGTRTPCVSPRSWSRGERQLPTAYTRGAARSNAARRSAAIPGRRPTAACTIAASPAASSFQCSPSSTATAATIFQSPGFMTITYEMVHDARVIRIDEAAGIGGASERYRGRHTQLRRRYARDRNDDFSATPPAWAVTAAAGRPATCCASSNASPR